MGKAIILALILLIVNVLYYDGYHFKPSYSHHNSIILGLLRGQNQLNMPLNYWL